MEPPKEPEPAREPEPEPVRPLGYGSDAVGQGGLMRSALITELVKKRSKYVYHDDDAMCHCRWDTEAKKFNEKAAKNRELRAFRVFINSMYYI